MQDSMHMEHNYYFAWTKRDCASAQCIVKCNNSVTGHKQRMVRYLQT
jgi:hypothetical protein